MSQTNDKKAQMIQRLRAAAEGRVTARELLQELEPLIADYFVLEADLQDEAITLNLYNGQRFILKVEEV